MSDIIYPANMTEAEFVRAARDMTAAKNETTDRLEKNHDRLQVLAKPQHNKRMAYLGFAMLLAAGATMATPVAPFFIAAKAVMLVAAAIVGLQAIEPNGNALRTNGHDWSRLQDNERLIDKHLEHLAAIAPRYSPLAQAEFATAFAGAAAKRSSIEHKLNPQSQFTPMGVGAAV